MNYKEDEIILLDKIKIKGKHYHYSIKTDLIEEILQIRDGNRRGKKVNVYNNSLALHRPLTLVRKFA